MSAKQAKRYRRMIRKEAGAIVKEFVDATKDSPFFTRLSIAWAIIRG